MSLDEVLWDILKITGTFAVVASVFGIFFALVVSAYWDYKESRHD